MKKSILIALVLVLILAPFALAAVNVQDDGTSQGDAAHLNFTGGITTFSADTASIPLNGTVEVITGTSETVTAADNGTTFIATAATYTTFYLPDSATGLRYTFTSAHSGTGATDMHVEADTTDTIEYLSTMSAGERITSAGATSDSVTVAGGGSSTWYVVDTGSSAWTDGGN